MTYLSYNWKLLNFKPKAKKAKGTKDKSLVPNDQALQSVAVEEEDKAPEAVSEETDEESVNEDISEDSASDSDHVANSDNAD